MNSKNKNKQPNGSCGAGRLAMTGYAAFFGFVVLGHCIFATASLAEPRGEIPGTLARTLEEVLVTYMARGKETLRVDLSNTSAIYEQGEYFFLEVEALDEDAFIYVDYFQLDGSVVHILPSPAYPDNRVPVGRRTLLGDSDGEVHYEILSPFGREMLVVTASREPLFSGKRDEVESGSTYLRALRASLSRVATIGRTAVIVRAIETYPASNSATARAAMQRLEPGTSGFRAPVLKSEAPRNLLDDAAETAESVSPIPRMSEAEAQLHDSAEVRIIGTPSPAALSSKAAPSSVSELKSYYYTNITPRLARMAGHPEDNENVSALAAAFGTYAQRLSEVGELAKARRTLDLALALDPSNGELAALYLEIEGASADREARAKGRLAAATGALSKDLSIEPNNEAVPANLGMSEQVDHGI